MVDSFLKWKKDFLIALIVIEINEHIRNLRNQPLQNFTLDGCEIEEAIKDEQLDRSKPWQSHRATVNLALENGERAKLIRVCFSELVPVQQFRVGRINQSHFLIKIILRVQPFCLAAR